MDIYYTLVFTFSRKICICKKELLDFMLFNSYIFIFIFLPVVLIGWYGLNHYRKYSLANLFLVGMSLWFYAYFNVYYLAIILSSIGLNYLLSFLLTKIPVNNYSPISNPADNESSVKSALGVWTRIGLITGILLNLGILFYFKYYDFFIENVNYAAKTNFGLLGLALPLGISFYTFQQLSYVIDAYRRECEQYSLLEYAAYVSFFPQLIAGPIVYHDELIPQFRKKFSSLNYTNLSKGIYAFALGMAKKVLILFRKWLW